MRPRVKLGGELAPTCPVQQTPRLQSCSSPCSSLLRDVMETAPGALGADARAPVPSSPEETLPCFLCCHPQPLLGRVARLQLQPTLPRKASVPFKRKQDQTRSSSLEFVGKRSSMNFYCTPCCYTQRMCWGGCGRIQPKSSAASGVLEFGLSVQPTVFHTNPLPLTQSSATDNREFLMQTWLLGMKDGW